MPIRSTKNHSKSLKKYSLLLTLAGTALCLFGLLSLAGCSQYRVSINDQPIEPIVLYHSYQTPDVALHRCIEETIAAKQIQNASELTLLNCSSEGISSLAGLQVFTQLAYINLDHNRVFSLASLLNIEGLKTVSLKKNVNVNCKDVTLLRDNGVKVHSDKCS